MPRITRAKWSSEKAFVLATAASAVGLGNIWRFPYIAGENGGGSFILAYLVAIIIIGLPLMLVEISAGRAEQGNVVQTFRRANKHAAWFGWFVIALTLLIMSYYFVITGWTLGYAIDATLGAIKPFHEFTSGLAPLFYFGIVAVLTAFVVFKGVKIIELLSKIMIPLLLLVILFMTGYSLTLDGASQAISFLFTPDWSGLTSPVLWALAFGQAFYSLAIGQGYLMTYGSFLPKKVNVLRATGLVAGIETSVAIIAGLMIFPIVFTFGLNPAQGTELAFATLPIAFGNISLGWILAIAFFWLLFVAAISSCIAGMAVVKTAVQEELKLTPGRATLLAFVPLVALGIISAFSFTPLEVEVLGRPFLEVMDILTANQVVIISGLVGGAILSWSIPRRKFASIFKDKYRSMVLHVIVATRFLWLVVLGILVASMML